MDDPRPIADDGWVDVLALIDHFGSGSDAGLEEYSERCLWRVWRAQHFSWWMTTMLHNDPRDDDYGRRLQRSQLEYVCRSEAAATSLAENYVGLPLRQATPEVLTHG